MVKNVFFYLLLEMVLLVACSFGEDDCGFAEAGEARVANMEARNVEYASYNNLEVLLPNDTLATDEYAIWLVADPEYTAYKSGGYQSLMACSPPTPILLDQIDSISIVSKVNIDELISNGTDITDHFFFKTENDTDVPIRDVSALNFYFTNDFYLFLVSDLEFPSMKRVSFDVTVYLDNQDIYRLTTNPVYLY
jgi:hypothetical protein